LVVGNVPEAVGSVNMKNTSNNKTTQLSCWVKSQGIQMGLKTGFKTFKGWGRSDL